MEREQLVVACCSDLAGQVRGKAFPASQFDKRLRRGVGWTPTNVQITCFDNIAESPFGSFGDLVLIPDPSTRVRLPLGGDETAEEFVLGDIKEMDGTPWTFCTRSILKAALDRLQRVSGLALVGAFEHEFQFRNSTGQLGDAFSLAGFRAERAFAEGLVACHAGRRAFSRYVHEGVRARPVRGHHGTAAGHRDRRPCGDPARMRARSRAPFGDASRPSPQSAIPPAWETGCTFT
jgi:glutamine synthetase